MLAEGTRPKWWFPIIAFITPGSCYAYAAFFPSFRYDFAVAGALLTMATSALLIWRVLRPKQTETHIFRLIGIHGFTLALLLITYRFWLASLTTSEIAIGLALFSIYIVALVTPVVAPSFAKRFYREVWFPESPVMRVLTGIALALGGSAGAVGAIIGMNASRELGRSLFPFMAVLTTLVLFFGTIYISTGLWRQKRGQHPIPSSEE